MGSILADGIISLLNNSSPAAQLAQLGTNLDNAIGGIVAPGSISAAELATDSVETLKIKDLNVTTDKLAAKAVENAKIGDKAVDTGQIADSAVEALQIATDAVEEAKIKDGAVTAAKLGAGVVLTAEGYFFHRVKTLTSAAAATGVEILSDAEVLALGAGKKVYVTKIIGKVNGATPWATTATIKVQDQNGTPVDFLTIGVAACGANEYFGEWDTDVTPEAAFLNGTGGTAAKGLRAIGDANGTGSDLLLTVVGFIK